MKLSNYYSHELKRIRLYWFAFCHSYDPSSLLAILSTLCLVFATHLTLLRDFDPLVIIIWSSSESFQSCITQILLGPHVRGRWVVSILFGNVDYIKYYSVSTYPVIRFSKVSLFPQNVIKHLMTI